MRLLLLIAVLSTVSCSHLLDSSKTGEKADLMLQAAVEKFRQRNFTGSVADTLASLKLKPDFPEAYNHLAIVYMETKRYDRAKEAFDKALSLRSDYPEVHNNIGVSYNRQGKFKEAIPHFRKALANPRYRTPENAYTNIGYAYYRMNKLTSAKANHQKALDVSPNFCLGAKNMADVYVKEKRYHNAQRYFQKAATNCPMYQEARYKLGLILVKLGKRTTAKTVLQRLVKQHKDGHYVERSSEVLKYLN